MSCLEIREKLLYYIENDLDENEIRDIRHHIENCGDCRKEYEEMLAVLKFAEKGFDKIKAPDNFMKNIRTEVKGRISPKSGRTKYTRTAFIAAALCIVFTITAFAASGFDFMKWWQDISLRESRSIEKLISSGYGEHVNVSDIDKDIKITIENVVADDTGTVISYSIEDIGKKIKYVLNYRDMKISGDFILPFGGADPYKGESVLYSETPYIQRGMFRLDPIKADSSTIDIAISKLYYGNEEPLSLMEGSWNFSIPVTKYESKVYAINEEVDIDGNKVVFKEIKISPTNTALTYSYEEAEGADYNISDFFGIKLISDGKEYKNKYMGASYSRSENGKDERTIEFDSMFFDNPDKVKIVLGGYSVEINKFKHYDIDINAPFPQVFEYHGSKISIDNVNIGDEKTEITLSQSFEENQYESLSFEFEVKGHPFANHPNGGKILESYTLDKKGRKVEIGTVDKSLDEIQPKTYFTKQQIILQDDPFVKELPQEYHDGKLVPVQLFVTGYRETRYIDKSVTVKLNK